MLETSHVDLTPFCNLQLVPFYGRKYVNVVRSIRAIGRHCIELRIKALRNKEKLPLDIMSQILSIVRECHG